MGANFLHDWNHEDIFGLNRHSTYAAPLSSMIGAHERSRETIDKCEIAVTMVPNP